MQRNSRKKPRQLGLAFRTWGGKRKNSGRKPKIPGRPGVPHRPRRQFSRRLPIHVTVRMAPEVYNLRSKRSFRALQKSFHEGSDRLGLRLLRFSVQGNHIHLLVEADDSTTLSRGMKGLSVRIARRMNRLMSRTGRVVGDRFHAHVLRTPSEVRRAIHYIRDNHRKHAAERGERLPAGWIDPYSSDSPLLTIVLPTPQSWLLTIGVGKCRAERAGPAKR